MRFGDDEEVTEDDVIALFEGGEEESEEETEDAEEETEEPEEEEEDSGDEEEEPEGDEDSEIDWSALPPRVKQAYDKIQSEAKKWQKDYGKIQSQWTKASQSQKEFESTRSTLEQRDQLLAKFEDVLESNPKLVEMIQKEVARKRDPFGGSDDVPDYLKQDPAFKYLEDKYKPLIASLRSELDQVRQKTSRFDEMDRKEAEDKNKKHLDSQLDSARGKIKSIFGRDATEDEVTQVLEYMVDKKFYQDGGLAALAVFGDKLEKAVLTRHQAKMKEKAKKFPSRNKAVASRGEEENSGKAMTSQQALAKALADQGY